MQGSAHKHEADRHGLRRTYGNPLISNPLIDVNVKRSNA